MDRLHNAVRVRCQKSIKLMFAFSRVLHRSAHAVPLCPDAGEEGEGCFLIERKPSLGLPWLCVFPLAKGCPRHHATVFGPQPSAPVRGGDVANVGHAGIRFALRHELRRRHAPSQPNQLPAALSIAHHWRWPVWIDFNIRLQVKPLLHDAHDVADRFLIGLHTVQITHAHLGNFAIVM